MTDHAAPFSVDGYRGLLPLAVTGGVAEGKTTVVGYLRELGLNCLSADDVARSVWDKPDVQATLASTLGARLPLDRAAVLREVAEDPAKRREVNRILHPEILNRLMSSGAQVVEIPLLVESCLQGLFRRVWVVTCGAEEQLSRLSARLGDEALARQLIDTQLASEVKCVFADEIVRTNQPPFTVHSEVVSLARACGFV